MYYIVGTVILVCGIIISLFFPLIFAKEDYPMLLIYVMFYATLGCSLLSYFVNYRQSLLGADQRFYIVSVYTQTLTIVCYILQIIFLYFTANPYIWISINVFSMVISSILLNWKIDKQYPWLKTSIRLGMQKYKEYPEIMKKTRQLFIHNIGGFAQFKLQPVVMYSFASLSSIGMYTNYSILSDKVTTFVGQFFTGSLASVGNLIAEGNEKKIMRIFYELFSLKMLAAGFLAFGLWHLTEPFLACWLGEQYIMSKTLLFLIVVNCYIMQTRSVTDQFLNGYGIFRDVWAPIVESIISVVVAIFGGYFFGLEGVLLGTIVSMSLIIVLWKPYLLFKDGFKQSVWRYWFYYIKSLVGLCMAFVISSQLLSLVANCMGINPYLSFLKWMIFAVVAMSIFSIVYFALLFVLTQGMRDFYHRMTEMLLKTKLRK